MQAPTTQRLIATVLILAVASKLLGDDQASVSSTAPHEGLQVRILIGNGCDGTRSPEPFIAGDIVITQIRVDGLSIGFDGKLDFSFRLDLLDGSGESIESTPWQRINHATGLGGDTFIFSGRPQIPSDRSTGSHRIRVSVKDELAGKSVVDEVSIRVLESTTFGATNPVFSMDREGKHQALAHFFAGQNAFLHFQFNGFAHTEDDMHVEATLTILDENAKPLDTSPIRLSAKSEGLQHVQGGRLPANFHFGLSRPGRFIFRLAAEDVLSGKTSTRDIPIRVIELTDEPVDGTAAKATPTSR